MITKKIYLVIALVFAVFVHSLAQESISIFGKWKTIDEETGEARSIVNIYEKDGNVFGKINHIINPADRDKTCIYCEGDEKDVPLIGLNIIKNLKEDDGVYSGGTIFDPEKGKKYKAKLWVDEENTNLLNVRGYIAFLFRTQQWVRATE